MTDRVATPTRPHIKPHPVIRGKLGRVVSRKKKRDAAQDYLDSFKGPPVKTGERLRKKVMREKGLV